MILTIISELWQVLLFGLGISFVGIGATIFMFFRNRKKINESVYELDTMPEPPHPPQEVPDELPPLSEEVEEVEEPKPRRQIKRRFLL